MTRGMAAVAVAVSFITQSAEAGLDSKRALYMGGTLAGLKADTEGVLDTTDAEQAVFTYGTKKTPQQVRIAYSAITGLEYGQKAGRRVGVGIALTPFALFSKKRRHFLTLSYKDAAGTEQAGVFELGKNIIRTTLTVLETRAGKPIEYQDDEARKSGRG